MPRTGGHYLSIAEVTYALLLRLFFATGAAVRRWPCAGRTPISPTAFCGSVALSHGSTGTWSLVSPRRGAHALTCPSPPRLWRSWVGQGEPSGRAGQGGLDLVLDGPRVHHEERDGSRPQERTAGDQRRGQGFGHERCRAAQVEARHAHARGRRAAAHRLGATRAPPSSRSPGMCTAPSPTRVRASPSSGSQQQSAGENVCRGYTNGYTAAKRPPRILSETASDLLFPVGMTGFEPAAP